MPSVRNIILHFKLLLLKILMILQRSKVIGMVTCSWTVTDYDLDCSHKFSIYESDTA